jgi:hypothetical protein
MKRRISRRRFLASSGATLAAASAVAVAGCNRKRSTQSATPTAAARPQLAPVASRGGVMRVLNFDAMIADSLDPHLTMMGPIANMHSAVFSRVLRYADEAARTLAPDLAEGMPEQPDPQRTSSACGRGVRFDAPVPPRLSKTASRGQRGRREMQHRRQADRAAAGARPHRAGN